MSMNSCDVGTGAICAEQSVSSFQRRSGYGPYLFPGRLHLDCVAVE
jgi:hypothetical protein